MPQFASTDWLVLLLYVLGTVGIGVAMRSSIKSSRDYFLAGRSVPTWVSAVAFIGASLGAPEVIGMGAAGAGFGFRAVLYFLLGSVPPLLFVALFMMPIYYGSGATTLPGYLGLRFDAKTRVLSAGFFVTMALASAGIALFMVARIFEALRIFDTLFFAYGWPRAGIFPVCILLAVVPVSIYVVIAGLRGTIISQVVQFFLLVAGFLPVVWIGLKNIGGWNGLHASLTHFAPQMTAEAGRPVVAGIALALGFVLGTARWTTDFRLLQMAMAAKCADSARKIGVVAAAAWVAIPFLFVLPGAIAISLQTPQSKTIVRNENGAIYHEITIVPRAISEGRGVVPALIDPATGNARIGERGHPMLDYGMATPNLITHFATTGVLGLAIAALLASLMSGVGAGLTAVSTVFTCDLYQTLMSKPPSDAKLLRTARWAAAGGLLLSVSVAFAFAAYCGSSSGILVTTLLFVSVLVFSVLQAPQLAAFVLGIFTRRIGGNGAFAGLVAGVVVALLHHGLTLPVGAHAGLQGGWLYVLHRYPCFWVQASFTVALSFVANLGVSWAASLFSDSTREELKSLVYPPQVKASTVRWKRPETLAALVMLVTLVLALVFA